MKLSELVNKGLALVLEKGDREVITAQKGPDADYTYGVVSDIVDYGDGTVGLVGSVENKVVTALDHEKLELHKELITRLRVLIQFMETNGATIGEWHDAWSLLELVQRDKLTAISEDDHTFLLSMEKKYLPGGEYRSLDMTGWKKGLANPGAPVNNPLMDARIKRLKDALGVADHESS